MKVDELHLAILYSFVSVEQYLMRKHSGMALKTLAQLQPKDCIITVFGSGYVQVLVRSASGYVEV